MRCAALPASGTIPGVDVPRVRHHFSPFASFTKRRRIICASWRVQSIDFVENGDGLPAHHAVKGIRRFLPLLRIAPIWRAFGDRFVGARVGFGPVLPGGEIPFPGNRDCPEQRLGSNAAFSAREGFVHVKIVINSLKMVASRVGCCC
jgi:hypothetical protein